MVLFAQAAKRILGNLNLQEAKGLKTIRVELEQIKIRKSKD
jgi:hypothetical protein